MSPRYLWLILLVAVLGLFEVRPAAAQLPPPPPPPGQLLDELDRTDRRIELASSLVPESGNPQAVQELSLAKSLQAEARSAFNAQHPVIAIRATLDARDHADRAIAIARGLPDPDHISLQVERTRDLLDRARERLDACTDARARGLLRVALEMQSRAEGAVTEGRYLAALQLTMSARERGYQALRACNLEESLQDGAQRAMQRTDDVLSRAHEAIDGSASQQAKQLLQRAAATQGEAQAEYQAGRFESALRFTQTARVLAQRAMRGTRTEGGKGAR